ncbi:unnamed protein product [Leptidea sinapis]|uniref:Uncharacterized protein n=1 Tax=Leptidea sinapis TaxID=189913 RepID=A0A5E4PPT0_9NEOP|nr:unnamed protein product [Leptidea sinapis]
MSSDGMPVYGCSSIAVLREEPSESRVRIGCEGLAAPTAEKFRESYVKECEPYHGSGFDL